MANIPYQELKTYLEFVAQKYMDWANLHTSTDREGKQSKPFDMGLMVKTTQSKEKQEKGEQLPVLEGLRNYAPEHVLLVGKPGSGKSTSLRQLLWEESRCCLEAIEQGKSEIPPIPILIELRALNSSVLAAIQEELEFRLDLDEKTLKALLRDRRLLVILDGLNELPNDTAWKEVDKFRHLCADLKVPLIFTTRELDSGWNLHISEKLTMLPLSEPQIQKFVQKRLPETSGELWRQIKGRLRELTETPLLLNMLCNVFEKKGEIPTNRGDLFRQEFARRYKEFKPERLRNICKDSRRFTSDLLNYLAFEMVQGDPHTDPCKPSASWVTLPKNQAEKILTKFLAEQSISDAAIRAKEWLEDLLEWDLLQVASDPDRIEFHHQLLQEYYAAEYLLQQFKQQQLNDTKLKRDYLNYLKWTEPLALMLALVDNENQAVQIVKLALEVDLMLGARLAGEVRREFQEKTVGLVLGLNISQELKFYLLGLTASEKALSPLLEAWNNRDYKKNIYTIAEALECVGYDEAMSIIRQSEDEQISTWNRSAEYEDEANSWLSQNIVSELINIGSSDTAISKLVILLNDEKLVSERSSDYYYFKGRNYKAKQLLGDAVFHQVISVLLQALNHRDFRVRYYAASALGNIGSEAEVVALIKAVKDENYFVRSSTIEALGKLGSIKAVSALIQAVSDETSFVRSRAVEALGKIGSKKAVVTLIQALNDEKYFVRFKVAEALGNIGDETAIPALIKALNNEELDVRVKVAEALGKIGSDAAIPGLIEALNNEELNVRVKVAEALGKIGSDAAIPALIEALNDEEPDVSSTAKERLLNIRNSLVEEALKNILHSSRYDFDVLQNISVDEKTAITLAKICNDCLKCIIGNSKLADKWKYLSIHLSSSNSLENSLIKSELLYQIGEILFIELMAIFYEKNMILAIQKECKFYNYEIAQTLPAVEENNSDKLNNILKKLEKTMSENRKNDFSGATFNNITGSITGNIQGDNIGTQHNYAPAPNIAEIEKVLQQLLEKIEQKKPKPIDAQPIVAQAVDNHPILKDRQVIEQAITSNSTLKIRLQKAVTAAGIETVKVIFAPAGIAIEAIRAWNEPE
ncbi:HEAT domain protein repeat-containing protein [Kalymmatonema gypsitolerans NIES-4073]|nr:HEAT domain protein repeat-containing protein [Scytonema sp. NIES-4073]